MAPPCSTWVYMSRGSTGRSYTRARGLVFFALSFCQLHKMGFDSLSSCRFTTSSMCHWSQPTDPEDHLCVTWQKRKVHTQKNLDCETNFRSPHDSLLWLVFCAEVWISLSQRSPLLHRKSNEHPAMDISSDGGMRNGNRKFLSVFLEIQFSISWQVTDPGHAEKAQVQGDLRATWSPRGTKREPLQQMWCFAFQIFIDWYIYIYIQSMAPISADPNWILTICFWWSTSSKKWQFTWLNAYPLRKRVTLYTTAPYLFALGTQLDPLQRPSFETICIHFQMFPKCILQLSWSCQGTIGKIEKQLEFETGSPLHWQTWGKTNSRRATLEAIWWISHPTRFEGWTEMSVFLWRIPISRMIVCPSYIDSYSLQVGSLLSEFVMLGQTNWNHYLYYLWCLFFDQKILNHYTPSWHFISHHFEAQEKSKTWSSARCRPSVPRYRWWQ